MTHVRTHRIAGAALVAALVLTACGQKPGVHVEDGTGGTQVLGQGEADGATPVPGSTGTDAGGVDVNDSGGGGTGGTSGGGTGGTSGGGDGGGDGGGTSGGGSGGSGGGSGGSGGGSGGDGGQMEVTGSDRTGVTDNEITVAFHAPVTGAAPLPAESFREARDLYWRHQAQQGRTFLGREKVNVLFQDDKYDPSNARQVCRQLASEALIVAGGGGTDQIQACGQLAGVDQFPYFSAGVTEAGLGDNPWYFASSMTYRQQGVLLAEYIANNFSGKKFGAIITDTQNFNDAVQGFEAGVQQAGIQGDYAGTLRHSKGDSTWYNQFGSEMANRGVEVLYVNTSPVDYIQFAQQNDSRNFQFVGVGVTMGLNAVLNSGCPEVDDGIFFSPFPGLDWARNNVPEFFSASQEFGTVADDLALALWGINKQLDLLFQRYQENFGTDLTREDFRALVEGSGRLESGIFPAVEYSPDNHFGGQSVHVLQADCSKGDNGEHVTLDTFATGF